MKTYLLVSIISIALLADTVYYVKKKVLDIKYLILNALCCVLAVVLKYFIKETSFEDGIEGALGMYTLIFNQYIKRRMDRKKENTMGIYVFSGLFVSAILFSAYLIYFR